MKNTKIEWADSTWNPWVGCQPGCKNCYAEGWAKRTGRDVFGAGKVRELTSAANWRKPLTWNRQAKDRPMSVFPSLCDPFDKAIPIRWFANMLNLVWRTPNLKWLLLTKRPENVRIRMESAWDIIGAESSAECQFGDWIDKWMAGKPPRNVALGVSAEDQQRWDERVPVLICIPAAMHFVSAEPLLGKIDRELNGGWGLDWVIIGGESGPNRREMDVEHLAVLADECKIGNVPCFIKQDSALRPGQQGRIPDWLWARKERPVWLIS